MTENSGLSAPEEIVQAQLDAYNARDLALFLSFYLDSIEVFDSPDGQKVIDGKSSLNQTYSRLFADNPSLHCLVQSRIVSGLYVIDHEKVTGIRNGELITVVIYKIKDGAIEKVWFAK